MKVRQLALAASDLAATRSTLFSLLGVPDDFADPGVGEFGLVNSVMALGDTFLEIVSPDAADTAAGRTLARYDTDACGYMMLFQVTDFARFDAHLDALGLRKVWQTERPEVSACHVHPKDIGGAIVSFDEMRPPQSWLWAGPDWETRRARHVTRILGCTVAAPNPEALGERWAEVLGEPLVNGRITFSDQTFVDFSAIDGDARIVEFTFASHDPDECRARAASLGLGAPAKVGELTLSFVAEPDL